MIANLFRNHLVKEWEKMPLEKAYVLAFMNAIHYHVRSEGRIVKRVVHIALKIDILSAYFKCLEVTKHLIYIANTIEEFHRSFQKPQCS